MNADAQSAASGKCPFHGAAESFDPFNPGFIKDPWPALAEMQRERPVFYSEELGFWIVTKYADVRKCFLDNKSFSAEITLDPIKPLTTESIESFIASGFTPGPVLVNEQPPTHKARRTRLQRQFEPKKLQELEPFVRQTVNSYIDRFVKSGSADLMRDFIYDIPALVVFHLLGLPGEELKKVKQWGEDTALFSWGRPSEREQKAMADALGQYWAYCQKYVEFKKTNLGDDFISDAIRGQQEEGEELWSDTYITRLMLNFIFAGHETTTNASGNAVMNLLSDRRLWEELVADPSKIPGAVNELLRVGSSIIGWRRKALVDVELSGVTIPAGSNLIIYNGAANRDPDVFTDPQAIDLGRDNATKLLSFGYGPHLCLGQPVAKLEMRVMLEELVRRLPHLELTEQEFTFSPPNTNARGPDHVFTRWDPDLNPQAADRPVSRA